MCHLQCISSLYMRILMRVQAFACPCVSMRVDACTSPYDVSALPEYSFTRLRIACLFIGCTKRVMRTRCCMIACCARVARVLCVVGFPARAGCMHVWCVLRAFCMRTGCMRACCACVLCMRVVRACCSCLLRCDVCLLLRDVCSGRLNASSTWRACCMGRAGRVHGACNAACKRLRPCGLHDPRLCVSCAVV